MARITNPSAREQKTWAKWVKSRPPAIRALCERFDPWSLYRLKTTGQRVTLISFSEGDPPTVKVAISGQFNATLFDRHVFGIDPDNLEPCDPPAPDEVLGSLLTDDEVDDNIDALRAIIRPDLWELGPDGVARRKQ